MAARIGRMDLAATLAKPAWSFEELCVVLGLPDSTVEVIAREQPAPPFFLLGRRRYILRADALDCKRPANPC